jgi:hypothetical protein
MVRPQVDWRVVKSFGRRRVVALLLITLGIAIMMG